MSVCWPGNADYSFGKVAYMDNSLEALIRTGKHPLSTASLVCSNFEQATQKQKRESMSRLFALLARSFQIQAREREKDQAKGVSDEDLISDFI